MTPRISIITFAIMSVLHSIVADGDSHHHRVIIHVPYKIHTIHHTILKHVHHQDKGSGDRYEVLGYTIGKAIEPGHSFHSHEPLQHHPPPPPPHNEYHHHQAEMEHQEFSGSNELGHGLEHDWTPSFGQHDFAGGGHHVADSHFSSHHSAATVPHYKTHYEPPTGHDVGSHDSFAGYE